MEELNGNIDQLAGFATRLDEISNKLKKTMSFFQLKNSSNWLFEGVVCAKQSMLVFRIPVI